ncbi:twitch domain-containing radical SAM protein [Haliscomenobacter sp.]|uniref:twitch domain-containing radical SAM protein n=1 Tax=Haliscomenobacter sp. TaxID=2717303 RepID=UPI003364BB9C
MNDLEFKHTALDPLSASFCAAKWYNATIWLGSGQTTSCHHPPAHLVDKDKVSINPRLLHNTDQKKADRALMIAGERPAGCEYCWKIEDMGRDAVSDRVYKSKIYPITTLKQAYETPPDQDVNLRTLEIAFDRTCQFACSYCNPAFSSTWVNDIRKHGAYEHLVSDGRNHFTHAHDSSQLYKFGETNPYVEAFFKWWESDLHKTLQELRITGGEPLMSGYTWKLIEWFKQNQGRSTTRLAINSNLGFDSHKLQEFVTAIASLPHVELYTSMEAVGSQAEYIRDGLDYAQWLANVHTLLKSRAVKALHVMCTINALCLDSLPQLLDQLMDLKRLYGRDQVSFTLNILRFPSFQSALVLPEHIRTGYRVVLEEWLYRNRANPWLHEYEVNHTQRLIDYLDVVKTPHSDTFEMPKLLNDFREFYSQYDSRRHKNFGAAFSKLATWYDSI